MLQATRAEQTDHDVLKHSAMSTGEGGGGSFIKG